MIRIRLRFSKTGALRYISHLDTVRIFTRCMRSSGLPLVFTKGFHPHPRMSLGPSLRTGWEGLSEYIDVFLEEPVEDPAAICNPHLPDGLFITGSCIVPADAPALSNDIAAARIEARLSRLAPCGGTDLSVRLDPLRVFREYEKAESGKPEIIDLGVEVDGDELILEYSTTMHQGRGVYPDEVLEKGLDEDPVHAGPVRVTRKELFLKRNGRFVTPLCSPEGAAL
jgi:radical SAM-linked protein